MAEIYPAPADAQSDTAAEPSSPAGPMPNPPASPQTGRPTPRFRPGCPRRQTGAGPAIHAGQGPLSTRSAADRPPPIPILFDELIDNSPSRQLL